MTDAQLTTIITGIPIILTSIGSLILALKNRSDTKVVATKAEIIASDLIASNKQSTENIKDVKAAISSVTTDIAVVHNNTNSYLTEQKNENLGLRKEIGELREMINNLTTKAIVVEALKEQSPLRIIP